MSVNEVLRKDLWPFFVEAAAGKANPVSHETRQKVVEFDLQKTVISCLELRRVRMSGLGSALLFFWSLHVDTSEPGGPCVGKEVQATNW